MANFLVIVSTRLDDYPVKLLTGVNLKQAREFADTVDAEDVAETQGDKLGRDYAEPISVNVVRFRSNGNPAESILVRDLDEEREEANAARIAAKEAEENRQRQLLRSGCR